MSYTSTIKNISIGRVYHKIDINHLSMESGNGLSKDDTQVEMTSMLDHESRDESGVQDVSPHEWIVDGSDRYAANGLLQSVEWKGQTIKTYPLDYQKIPIVKWQIACCLIMFSVFGLSDQAVGALIPTLTEYYHISKATVSLLFLIQVCGYTLASLCNEKLHRVGGTRGAMLSACGLCIITYLLLLTRPSSFIIYATCSFPLGLSIGILDSTGNVLIGSLSIHKNEWMGILHGIYGAAAMVTPPIASYFVKMDKWSTFYALPLSLSVVGLLIIPKAFQYETSTKYGYICAVHQEEASLDIEEDSQTPGFFELLKTPAIILYASYLFIYLGAELSTGSWLFSYLLGTKSDDKIRMSWVTSSYWTGLTVGRMCLGFVTKRVFHNEYRASKTYGILTLSFYTLFVVVGWHDSARLWYLACLFIIVFLCGVFIGPLFPNASIVALQVLPKNLHISGVGLAVALGGCGNAMLPYLVGLGLHFFGMSWLPILCWSMVLCFNLVWSLYPRFIKGREEYL